MVIILELQFRSWQHEECNAGMIDIISEYYKENVIKLYADSNHIEAIKTIKLNPQIIIKPINVPKGALADEISCIGEYFSLLMDIIFKNHLGKNDKIIFLSTNKGMILATMLVSLLKKPEIYFVCHASLDFLLDENMDTDPFYNYKKIMNATHRFKNFHWIAFNPFVRKHLKGILHKDVLKRMFFIHLPIADKAVTYIPGKNVIIGVYGGCVKVSARFLIERLNEVIPEAQYSFKILQSTSLMDQKIAIPFPAMHTRIIKDRGGISHEHLLKEMEEMDWILLPYTKNQYMVSMSGILATAVAHEIPIIAFDSPIITWYGQWDIGIIGNDIEDTVNKIVEMLNNPDKERARYIENIKKMKVKITKQNKQLLKKIFG